MLILAAISSADEDYDSIKWRNTHKHNIKVTTCFVKNNTAQWIKLIECIICFPLVLLGDVSAAGAAGGAFAAAALSAFRFLFFSTRMLSP